MMGSGQTGRGGCARAGWRPARAGRCGGRRSRRRARAGRRPTRRGRRGGRRRGRRGWRRRARRRGRAVAAASAVARSIPSATLLRTASSRWSAEPASVPSASVGGPSGWANASTLPILNGPLVMPAAATASETSAIRPGAAAKASRTASRGDVVEVDDQAADEQLVDERPRRQPRLAVVEGALRVEEVGDESRALQRRRRGLRRRSRRCGRARPARRPRAAARSPPRRPAARARA